MTETKTVTVKEIAAEARLEGQKWAKWFYGRNGRIATRKGIAGPRIRTGGSDSFGWSPVVYKDDMVIDQAEWHANDAFQTTEFSDDHLSRFVDAFLKAAFSWRPEQA